MTVKSLANSGMSMRQAYQVWGHPWISRSGGPSPPTTAWRRTSPAWTYRLVNVAANPDGRLGAPETEPGQLGVDAWADTTRASAEPIVPRRVASRVMAAPPRKRRRV